MLWDFENYLAGTDADNELQAVYTNEPQQYGNLISQYRRDGEIWTPSYYQCDVLGSTRALTDDGGDATDTYIYDASGNGVAVSGLTVNPFRWVARVGYYYDAALGTFYIRARVYEPVIGRWMSQDSLLYPVASPLGPFNRRGSTAYGAAVLNLFNYVAGMIFSQTDPSGMYAYSVLDEDRCNDDQMDCIDAILASVQRVLSESANENDGVGCFAPFDSRSAPPNSPARKCRQQLTKCLLDTMGSLMTLGCREDGNNPAGANEHHEYGTCLKGKNEAARKGAVRGKCEPDPSCEACPFTDLLWGWIEIDSSKIPTGGGRSGLSPREACERGAQQQSRRGHVNIVETLVHEFLHFCVGGHTADNGDDSLRRPDARNTARDFLRNCGGRLFPLRFEE